MNKSVGILLTSLFSSALITSVALAEDAPKKLKHNNSPGEKLCQNNNCAGHSECMGYGNEACGGGNSCKGKGWVSASTEAECSAKQGIWHGKKAGMKKEMKKMKEEKKDQKG